MLYWTAAVLRTRLPRSAHRSGCAAAAPAAVGSLDRYDHVMIYMPPGVDMGAAAGFGYVGGKYTWYRDGYHLATGIQLHELG